MLASPPPARQAPVIVASGDQKFTKSINRDLLEIVPLGGGSEVGRSCIMVKFKGKLIMLDCGIHPASNDISALPFFDLIDPAEVDLLLVTHFHLDHCGAVPYLTEKTNFKAPIYMTHPTKAIYKHVLEDSLKVSEGDKMLFDTADIDSSLEKISVVNFHQEVEVEGIKFTCYAAGHVLGACMFLIDIAGTRILYTGDYSREEDRHLKGAEIPQTTVDVLIVESTYGIKTHDPRESRERTFLETVRKIVTGGGHCLLPVFVLGRAQEILLILEKYWESDPSLHKIPIYYASTLMAKCMMIFQKYINMMGDWMRESFKHGKNPFDFKHIKTLRKTEEHDDDLPSVVMASPGMLQKGMSRTLFEKWCSCQENGVIFTGYCVESTLAHEIQKSKPKTITTSKGEVPFNMSVHYVSFSAHADFKQTRDFIKAVDPTQVILVHGETHEANRMRTKLIDEDFKDKQIFIPRNWQVVEIPIESKLVCKVEGHLITKIEEIMQQKVRELEGKGRLRINRQPDWQDLPPGAAPNKYAAEIAKEAKKQSEKADQNGGPSSKRVPREERSKSRNRREDSDGSHSPHPHERGDQKKKPSKDEEKKGGHGGHGHKHLNPVDFAEGFEDTYIDVPFDGFLLKKHFDYILVDNENVTEYTGKSETKINHMLRIPYKGSLQLVSHLVAQLYYNSRMDHKSEDERVIIDDSIFIRKDELNECLEFRWVANKKNDIAADCLAYMFSQFPDNKEFDLFQMDMPKTAKERELELLKKKVLKRVLGVFDDCTYKEDKTNRHLLHFQGRNYEFKVNLETGAVREASEDAIRKRVTSIISNLFEPGNLKYS